MLWPSRPLLSGVGRRIALGQEAGREDWHRTFMEMSAGMTSTAPHRPGQEVQRVPGQNPETRPVAAGIVREGAVLRLTWRGDDEGKAGGDPDDLFADGGLIGSVKTVSEVQDGQA